jgi:uncharacterized SAM-binding protein YcdF (DUF218 family)
VKQKWLWVVLAVPVLLFFCECVYYFKIYLTSAVIPDSVDLVLVYSGDEDRARMAHRVWKDQPQGPLFLFSGWNYTEPQLEWELGLPPARFFIENRALTTDQNARYSAPILRKLGVHSVLLSLPWYHLPRSLFLTRYYLRGSGITVTPFATSHPRRLLWAGFHLALELVKFWGSLMRVGLAHFGVENWPPPHS